MSYLLLSLVNSHIHNISLPSFQCCKYIFQNIEEQGIAIFQHFSNHKLLIVFSVECILDLTHNIASLLLYTSTMGVLKLSRHYVC